MRSGLIGFAMVLACGMVEISFSAPVSGGQSMSAPDPQVGGVVTTIVGRPTALTGRVAHPLSVGSVVSAGEELRVGSGDQVEVLWDHRAVLTLRDEAHVTIQEAHRGQTDIRLHQGTVRIALAYDAGRMTDRMTLDTPFTHSVGRGGVMEVSVSGHEPSSPLTRWVKSAAVDRLRVVEGILRVEPLVGPRKPFSLKAGSEVAVTAQAVPVPMDIVSDRTASQPLPVREAHRILPAPVTQLIVGAQVGSALELEKDLQQAQQAALAAGEQGGIVKGAVVATSFGLPPSAAVPTTPIGAGSGTTVAPTPVVSPPLAPAIPPLFSLPTVGAVAPASVQTANLGTNSPSQSGGLNTGKLLQQLIKDTEKAILQLRKGK